MEKKVLNLSLTKEWYEKVASGEKTDEYREIKPYWTNRLFDVRKETSTIFVGFDTALKELVNSGCMFKRPYTHVRFTNGYPKGGEPYIEKEIVSITIGKPKKGLCPDKWLDKDFFVIKFK